MGLFSKKIKYTPLKIFHRSFIKLLIFFCNDLFFLGKRELSRAVQNYGENEKFMYVPFSIDMIFGNLKRNIITLKINKYYLLVMTEIEILNC